MKNIIVLIGLVCLCSCSNRYQEMVNEDHDYQIVPKPEKLTMTDGRFLINSNTKIISDVSLAGEATYLSEMIEKGSNKQLEILAKGSANGNIYLKLDSLIESPEGYILRVSYNQIMISGKTPAGVFYGIQSLRQLMPAAIETEEQAY